MINQEEIFQSIQKENWSFLISVLKQNKNDIATDPLLKQAASTFVSEFFKKVSFYPDNNNEVLEILDDLWKIHLANYFNLSDNELKILIPQFINRKKNKEEVYNFAKVFPNDPNCKTVIENYEKHIPKKLEHSQSHRISFTETKEVANVDFTINLFKSNQEKEFFYALKRTFETYQIYPNVAISCLLDWELINADLTFEERNYFFTGIVDVVVFDQAKGFKPIHFFELDSKYHDNPESLKKDQKKDSIFAKAGIKIKRVRKKDEYVGEEEFIMAIRELLKTN